MLAYIHQTCGKPAFLLSEWPLPLSHITSRIALHLNGQHVEEGIMCVCESCGTTMNAMELHTRNIRQMIWETDMTAKPHLVKESGMWTAMFMGRKAWSIWPDRAYEYLMAQLRAMGK